MKSWLALFVLTVTCQARAAGWPVEFKKEDGSIIKVEGSVAEMTEDKRKIVFLAVPSPVAALKSASQLTDDAPPEVPTKEIKGRMFLLLSASRGNVELTDKSGAVTKYDFEVKPAPTAIRLSATCAPLNVQQKVSTKILSPYPAAIACVSNGKEITEVTFSTMADAEWYGTGVFEIAGKGERWKAFAPKDIMALPKWDVAWGSGTQKNKVRFVIPPLAEARPTPPPKPAFQFWVGGQYITGTITQDKLSTPLAGLQVPLGVIYHRENARWLLGSGYDFFAYATSKAGDGTNSLSGWNMWAGYQFRGQAFQATGALGFLNRTIDASGVKTSSTFEAPRVSLDIGGDSPKRAYGLNVSMAQTSNQGTFSEMDLGFYYEWNWGTRRARAQVSTNQLKATAAGTDFQTAWTAAGLNFKF